MGGRYPLHSQPPWVFAQARDDHPDIEFDEDDTTTHNTPGLPPVPAAELRCKHAVFRVNITNLSQWKRLTGDRDKVGFMDALVVQRHYILGGNMERRELAVSLAPAIVYNSAGMRDTLMLLSDADLGHVCEWKVANDGRLEYSLASFTSASLDSTIVRETIRRLVDASAWPASLSYLVLDDERGEGATACLAALQAIRVNTVGISLRPGLALECMGCAPDNVVFRVSS